MTSTPTKKQLTHDRIVQTAAQAMRRGGFAGVGVADVMKQAGLTHGGFYAHFPSRDALLCEALEQAGRESADRIARHAEARAAKGGSAFRAFIENYLSEAHLAALDGGCPVAALAADMPRQSSAVSRAGAERVRSLIAAVQRRLPTGRGARRGRGDRGAARRRRAARTRARRGRGSESAAGRDAARNCSRTTTPLPTPEHRTDAPSPSAAPLNMTIIISAR